MFLIAIYLFNISFRLPAFQMEEKIVRSIGSNQVSVVSGDTGCGKTTQVPQLVLDDMIRRNRGSEANIIVTQPRRISAIGVSERIASERCERVGETVGYSIRLENKRSARTRLLLCTTGILLRRLQCDPGKYEHENGDGTIISFLLIILKNLLFLNADLASVSHVFVDEVSRMGCTVCVLFSIPWSSFQCKYLYAFLLYAGTRERHQH